MTWKSVQLFKTAVGSFNGYYVQNIVLKYHKIITLLNKTSLNFLFLFFFFCIGKLKAHLLIGYPAHIFLYEGVFLYFKNINSGVALSI